LKKPPSKVLDVLGAKIRAQGCGLLKAPSEDLAKEWAEWLEDALPGHFGAVVIRKSEVNVYSVFTEPFPDYKRVSEKEIMRIARMEKKPYPWWKDKKRAPEGPMRKKKSE